MKSIAFEGSTHQFPDDATDEEIAEALEAMHPDNGGQAGGMGDVKMAESPNDKAPAESSNIFPSATREYNDRFSRPAGSMGQSVKDFAAVGLAGAGDVGGLLQRGAAALLTDQKMSDPGAHALKSQTDAAVSQAQADLDAHPELKDYTPPGGFGGMPMMMPTPAMAPGLTEVGGRTADDPMMYLGPLISAIKASPKLLEYLGKAAGVANKGAGRLAEEMSGVSQEALRKAGTAEGRATLEGAAGKEGEIGSKLLSYIDNADQHMPEKQVVEEGLKKLPPQSVQPAIDAMEKVRAGTIREGGRIAPHARPAHGFIQGYIDYLRGGELPPDLAEAATEAGRTAQGAKAEAVAKGSEAAQNAKQAAQAERQAAAAQSKATKAAGQAGATKKTFLDAADKADRNVTRYGGERNAAGAQAEASLEEAQAAAQTARQAATEARARAAVGDVTEADAKAAEAAADAAEKTHQIAQVAARLKAGDKLQAIAKDFSAQGMPRENLGAILKAGKARVESIKDLPPQELSAPGIRAIRQDLDVPIDFAAEGADIRKSALKAGRGAIKDQLIAAADASGDAEYAKAMKAWSDKLDKLDRIKDLLGQTGAARERRVESFIDNLFGKNSKYKTRLMQDLDQIFGSNLTAEARDAQLASQFGPDGKVGWMPMQTTGRSMLGLAVAGGKFAVAAPFASPKIASRVTLPRLTSMEKRLKEAGIALTPRAASVLNKMKGPVTDAQRARMAVILANELEAQIPNNVVPFRRKVAEDDDSAGERRAAR